MRIPMVPSLSTKDGTTNKNSRLTNVLVETRKTGKVAQIRPALHHALSYAAGSGNGLVEFNDKLLSIFDADLVVSTIPDHLGEGLIDITEAYNDTITKAASLFISKNGLCVVGEMYGVSAQLIAYKWVTATKMVSLGTLGGTASCAYGITEDLVTTIGYARDVSGNSYPFRHTDDEGMTALPGFTANYGGWNHTSPNGQYFVISGLTGHYVSGAGPVTYAQTIADDGTSVGNWSSTQFKVATWAGLATTVTVTGATTVSSTWTLISGDGTTVWGVCNFPDSSNQRLYSWDATNGVRFSNTTPMTGVNISVNSVSYDGSTIAFWQSVGGESRAFTFSHTHGFTYINLFEETGALVINDIAISGDGGRVVGIYKLTGPTRYRTFVWDAIFKTQDIGFITSSDLSHYYNNTQLLSYDGWSLCAVMYTDASNYHAVVWSQDTGTYLDLADLVDQQFDFAQSTL